MQTALAVAGAAGVAAYLFKRRQTSSSSSSSSSTPYHPDSETPYDDRVFMSKWLGARFSPGGQERGTMASRSYPEDHGRQISGLTTLGEGSSSGQRLEGQGQGGGQMQMEAEEPSHGAPMSAPK
jgi:hypothetical protein